MKIAIVANTTWNIVNFRLPLIRALQECGHEVVAISPSDSYLLRLQQEGIEHLKLAVDSKGNNPLKDLATLCQLYRLYRQHSVDVVLHYTIKPVIYGGMAARLLGIPAINTITGLGTAFIKQNWITKTVCVLYRIALKRAAAVLFQNHDDMSLFLQLGLLRPELAGIVPGSGIDTSYFSPQNSSASDANESPVFLLVARMLRDKGVCEYVEAAREVRKESPQVRFQLLGPFDVENKTAIEREKFEEWIKEGCVEYYPPVDDVRPMLAQATCIVLPSYREGLPRTLLEAAAMGKPLVATDVAGCRDVVIDGVNGYLCQVGDSEDLALTIKKMLCHDTARRKKMGEAARLHVISNFDEGVVVSKYLDAIREIEC